MKMKISTIKHLLGCTWQIEFDNKIWAFNSYEGMEAKAHKLWKRYTKEQAAFSMLGQVVVNLLTIDEAKFVAKLIGTKCRGISPKQYGYLKGIHERQARKW